MTALADCTCFHAANPKAGKGLFAIRLFIDKAENEFPLAPAVCRIVLGGDFSDIVTRWHPMGR